MTWYKTGTTTLTNGSAVISGSGTLWVDAGVLFAGDIFAAPDGKLYEILSIQSNTGLTLASNYLGATASGQAYAIMPIGLLPSALALQVKTVLNSAQAAVTSSVLYTAAQGLTTPQQAAARANIAAYGAGDALSAYALSVSSTLSATKGAAAINMSNTVGNSARSDMQIQGTDAGGVTKTYYMGVNAFATDGSFDIKASNGAGINVGATGTVTMAGPLSVTSSSIGYGTGAGVTVAQATSKSTPVTANKPSGQITLHNAALAAGDAVAIFVTNSYCTATSVVAVSMLEDGATTLNSYSVQSAPYGGGGAFYLLVKNISAGSLSEALKVRFAVISGANA